MSQAIDEAATPIEKADVATAEAVMPYRDTPLVKVLGTLSDLSDQPPLIALCCATLAAGLWRGNRRQSSAGARMLASHLLATAIKKAIKARIDRTRPAVLDEEGGHYEMKSGHSTDGKLSSFPSGHTAGAAAVARAFSRDYPEYGPAAAAAATSAALLQIPRCAHYPSDLVAGAAVGLAAEAVVDRIATALVKRESTAT